MKKRCVFKKTKSLRSFHFGDISGLKKSKKIDKQVHRIMINTPDLPVGPNGESFNQAAKRSINFVDKILKTKGNDILVSHNSILNMIDLWFQTSERGLVYLEKSFRELYTNNKVKKRTGSCFKIKKQNGDFLYLVRHGDTEDTAKNVYSTEDGKLTDGGIEEARKIAKFFANKKINTIYTSDLPRTVKTSRIIFNKINKK